MSLSRPASLPNPLRLLLLLAALLLPGLASADTQDVTAASRSVVRVALVATDGESAYFVGHGSGVVVAPGKVLTNAHVVELTRNEPNIAIGIIPPEGKKSYGGRLIAFSPGNDLALIAYDTSANLPVATFFSGGPADGQQVTAIGYPGSVDRAQGMNLEDIIHPMSPVRTSGSISGGRASKQFDTVLHTAPLASGNSGGPLIDECGRVLGINSFGSLSDGNDAEYGFAVSDREIANFLRQAGVQPQRSIEPCRSLAEIDAAQKLADEQDRAAANERASQQAIAAREKALSDREDALKDTIARRDNMQAVAALMLVLALFAGGGAMLAAQGKVAVGRERLLGGIAGALLLGAVAVYFLQPSLDSPDKDGAAGNASASANIAEAPTGSIGNNLCRIDAALSRVTVSDTADVPLNWTAQGCINRQTQMIQNGTRWSRIMVPADEASISVRRFDPDTGGYRSDKYLVGADVADQAREMRKKLNWSGCTSDPERLAQLARLQTDLQMLLPQQPNERLVYHCSAAAEMPATKPATAPQQ